MLLELIEKDAYKTMLEHLMQLVDSDDWISFCHTTTEVVFQADVPKGLHDTSTQSTSQMSERSLPLLVICLLSV